ncbi:MAG: DUF3786 domain-containing protein [Desulfobacter sp.]|nr:DUF3786 domain-containing protein [Desulfobacter sp.]WDP83758.1 MAG: DUF3786 domain-containing protein [Desulfobacter sp.]
MSEHSKIFETHYQNYCRQIQAIDLDAIKKRLNIQVKNNIAHVRLFDQTYQVSGRGIFDEANKKADYVTCVILSKYLLNCPDQSYLDADWCTFRDFKKESHFTNANFFNSDTTRKIIDFFSGRLIELKTAAEHIQGVNEQTDLAYDLSFSFTALPRLSLLLLVNEADDDFPADCKVLFQRQGEYYLDPESLAMTSGLLAQKLIRADETKGD